MKHHYGWYAILVGTMLLWSTSYVVLKVFLFDTHPVTIVLYRFMFAALALAIILLPQRRLRTKLVLTRRDWWLLIVAGICDIVIAGLGLTYGVMLAGASLTALLLNSNLIFITLFVFILKLEGLSFTKIAGVVMGLAGIILIMIKDYSAFDVTTNQQRLGMALALLGAICVALSSLINKSLAQKMSGMQYTFYSIIPAGCLAVIVALVLHPQILIVHSYLEIVGLAYIGIFCTAITWSIASSSYAILPASTTASFKLLIPIFTAILAYSILGERFTSLVIVGMILTISGIFLVIRVNKHATL